MTNNTVKGTKKSAFTSSTTIPSGSYLDFVVNGQNLRIKDTDFYAALAVTGSITQEGDPNGVPVLDAQGSINAIRNITGEGGVSAVINAYNGITLSSSFTFDSTGGVLVDDATATPLNWRSMVGGNSMTVTESSGVLTFDADTDGLKPSNRVIINQASDFPTAVGGFIPLAPDTEYYIGAKVTVANPFSLTGDVVFGGQPYVSQVTYAGSGDLFTGTDSGALVIKGITLDFPNADLFNLTNTTPASVVNVIDTVIISGNSLGTCTDIVGIVFSLCAFLSLQDGYTAGGTDTSVISVSRVGMASTSATFKAVDLGSNVYDSLEVMNLQVTAPAGAFGISGLVSSGNISVGQIGNIQSCEFLGGCTPLENITRDDVRYNFIANGGIVDTAPDALLSLESNATDTVISTINTPVLVAGTWTIEDTSQFTGTVAGRATYNGERDITAPITVSLSVEPASGTNKDITAYVAINGSIVSASGVLTRADNANPIPMTLIWQQTLSENDYVEVFVENNTDTVDILVGNAVLRIL